MLKYLLFSCAIYYLYYVRDISAQQADLPVSQPCLGCICEAISGCNVTRGCVGDICGPFSITWGYWADGGKPTSKQQSPEEPTAYGNCANDPYCGAIAVQGYMQKFQQDCTGDGNIDCDDFAAIHALGGYGCRGTLPDFYAKRYQQCKQIVGNLHG
ncbi:hypothetical protein ILUMI_24973 [Ignelater luminosus]|uniref:lysozyme n=1 Tax=Ignelater luminosus TaxID=2038154 RepID=A0A8K0CAW1_IGNLU|nr:hypothetical protein ILUMI_24973 [Ignelater luminosus]